MKSPYEMLHEFHTVFDAGVNLPPNYEHCNLRTKLIAEETEEVLDWLDPNWTAPKEIDKKALTKELADLMYVTIGTAVTFGLPLEEVFAEVHKSNMSKVALDGTINRRADGKILKPDTYKPPELDKYFV